MRIADQLHHVIAALNARGVIPGPLKGALHMLEGTFRHPAERVMADLDLLVPPADLDRATEALRSLGYQEPAQAEFKTQHEVLLTGPGQQVPVEIHSDLGVPAVTRVLSASTYLKGMAVERRGLTYRVADPAHVVLHNVLHAQIQDHNHMVFGLPLRQLHTLTAFVDRHESHLDWSEVRHRMAAANLTAMLDSYLDLAHQFMAFPGDLAPQPSRALWARRAMCVANTDLRGRPGDLVRNVQEAFDADYVRSRYGGGSSLLRLRTRHASVLWRTQGKGTLNEAAAVSRWR